MDRNPKGLEKIASEYNCNARTPTGYCKKRAGWGTAHVGKGRCKLHGGNTPGRPIKHGLYSKKMKASVAAQLKEMVEHPAFASLYSEFGLLKLALSNIIGSFDEEFFNKIFDYEEVLCHQCGGVVLASSDELKRFTMMVGLIEKMGRTYDRIIKAEVSLKKVITVHQLQFVYKKIANLISEAVGDPKQQKEIYERLMETDLFFEPSDATEIMARPKPKRIEADFIVEEDVKVEEMVGEDIFGDGQLIVY